MKRTALVGWFILLGVLLVSAQELTLDFHFPEPVLVKRTDGYVDIQVDGLKAIAAPGAPVLPSYPARILVPQGYQVAGVDIKGTDPVELGGGIRVNYFRGHFPTAAGNTPVAPDAGIYGSADPFPAQAARQGGTHFLKGYPILLLTLQPFTYFPAEGRLLYVRDMTVTVRLAKAPAAKEAAMRRPIQADLDEVAGLVDNPGALEVFDSTTSKTLDTTYEYLIITSSTLQATFQTLATHKAGHGLNTHIELISNIYASYPGADNAEKLRNFIIWAYQNHGTRYVLLGGDSDVLPWRGCYGLVGSESDNSIPTDFYFAALDGNWNADGDAIYGEPTDDVDLFAEVSVGRISASTTTEAANQINKIIAYENSSPPFSTLLLGESLDASTWGGDSKDVVYQEMAGIPRSTLYDRDGTWSKSTLINNYFNTNNTHIVNHLGHANDTYVMKMYNSDVASLTNTNPFFVYSQGCIPGNFPLNDRCFAEEITVGTTKGAFAVIMNSRYGWYASGATNGTSNYFDWEFMEDVFEQFQHHIGTALNDSRHRLANYIDDGSFRWVYYEQILFGCPETQFHWNCTSTSLRVVPQDPVNQFIQMQDDPMVLAVAVHTDCAEPPTGATVTAEANSGTRATVSLLDDGVAPDEAANDGIFTGTWTPTAVGPASIQYTAVLAGLTSGTATLAGEVVEFMQYHEAPADMAWIDASGGTSILASQDDAGAVVAIGFPFKFYGKSYTSVLVSSNGLLRFDDAYTWDAGNTPIPDSGEPNPVIAALWTDLKLNTSARVFYLTTGSAPNRKFVAEWYAIPHFDGIGAATFEIVLEESTNNIFVYYQDTDFGNASYNAGADATAGIEDYNGKKGIQHSYKEAVLTSGLALLYTPVDGPVISTSDHDFSGGNADDILDLGETLNVTVTLYNAGTETAYGVSGEAGADNGVTFSVATHDYGDIAAGATAQGVFTFTIPADLECGTGLNFTVQFDYEDAGAIPLAGFGTFAAHVGELVDLTTFQDNMEAGVGSWTTQLVSGVTNWAQVTTQSHSTTHSWFSPDEAIVKDNYLITPLFQVPVNATLTFWHNFTMESTYDGCVIEIQPEGSGNWTDLGSLITSGGYTHTISTGWSNPLAGRPAWSGSSGGWQQPSVNLAGYAGQNVQIRFRIGCDSMVSSTGWYVDDVRVSGFEYQCDAVIATGDVDESGTVDLVDLAIIQNTLVGKILEGQAPCTDPAAGDFDGCGHLSAADTLTLAHMLAGNQ